MSIAISRLHLEQPPVTVQRIGSKHAPLWRVECGECGRQTKPNVLISNGLADQAEHAAIHAYDARIKEAERRASELRAFDALVVKPLRRRLSAAAS